MTDGDLQQVIRNVNIGFVREDLMNGSIDRAIYDGTDDSSSSESAEHLNCLNESHLDDNSMILMNDALHDFEFNEADVDILMEL